MIPFKEAAGDYVEQVRLVTKEHCIEIFFKHSFIILLLRLKLNSSMIEIFP